MSNQIGKTAYSSQSGRLPERQIDPRDGFRSKGATVPTVNEGSVCPLEYYVKTLNSSKAFELEEKLNDASREGWQLLQIIQDGEQKQLVFVRQLGKSNNQ
ncbi:MAG TPA: hypothetical protein VJ302_38140 [Blastocatellia bacterium]|nr:hypothetical protein [Blastocatellia bacterium]